MDQKAVIGQYMNKTPEVDMCPTHKKPLDLICIDTKERICYNCALFGAHKGLNVKE